MECKACFFKLNEDFSPEFAEANNDGKPSENNRLYEWEDELVLKNDIRSIDVLEGETYILRGEINGNSFEEEVKNMFLFNIIGEDDSITQMACSALLVERYEVLKEDKIYLNVFLKGSEPLSNPVPGIYIALQEFPKSLLD